MFHMQCMVCYGSVLREKGADMIVFTAPMVYISAITLWWFILCAQVSFLEVSHLSFVRELGMKGKEGVVQKRTGSTQRGRAGCNLCGLLDNYICARYSSDALSKLLTLLQVVWICTPVHKTTIWNDVDWLLFMPGFRWLWKWLIFMWCGSEFSCWNCRVIWWDCCKFAWSGCGCDCQAR
jgi:hypothetical protein